jgi:hypothetical protein
MANYVKKNFKPGFKANFRTAGALIFLFAVSWGEKWQSLKLSPLEAKVRTTGVFSVINVPLRGSANYLW